MKTTILTLALLFGALSMLEAQNPPKGFEKVDQEIVITAVRFQMKYDVSTFNVEPESTVKLTFRNPDDLPHNLIICTPGKSGGKDKGEGLIEDVLELGAKGEEMNWEPKGHPRILHSSGMVQPKKEAVIWFKAPKAEGAYPYVCTFPGHFTLMNGMMKVSRQDTPGVPKPEAKEKDRSKDLLKIGGEVVVAERTRIFRAPIVKSSGRAIHVGLPDGMNYTFDPRTLAVRNIWGGGFLNLNEERRGRGQPNSRRGDGSQTFIENLGILRPVIGGSAVDFEFKEPDVKDHKNIEKWLWEDRDFPELLASVDANYHGHSLESATGDPVFRFRVGQNEFLKGVRFSQGGRLELVLRAELKTNQVFEVSAEGLSDIKVGGGKLADGKWTLQAGTAQAYTFSAKLEKPLMSRPYVNKEENWGEQPVVRNKEKGGKKEMELPPGYSFENWEAPKDIYGRDQLFEPTGIAVAKDGTVVVATRTAGIWRIRNDKWTKFAEGTYECLGVWIEDDKGDQFVVMQKPELTRMKDSNGDGRGDSFETVCDDYGFHGNYHEYAHGPVRDKEGNYYFSLNLSHGGNERTSWRAGGPFMGSMGGYRGWACRVTPGGKFEPFANGLRSPAGIGVDPEGRIWYAENQGEYVGSSKVVPLEKGKFYGHLSGLLTLQGKMKPDSAELKFDKWKDKIRKGAVWLPHGMVANSPGNPAWDTTGGKFGPFGGQMFLGDQTLSNLFRVVPEQVNGIDQGCVIPFGRFFASGVMRPVFLPDGSLLVGQTGRGWGAWGGQQASLQRIMYDGKTVAAAIHSAKAAKNGFLLSLTRPLGQAVSEEQLAGKLKVRSWFYTNTGRYGSPRHEERDDAIERVHIDDDRKRVLVVMKDFGTGDRKWLDRLYNIEIPDTKDLFGTAPVTNSVRAYFTLRIIP